MHKKYSLIICDIKSDRLQQGYRNMLLTYLIFHCSLSSYGWEE